MADRNIKKRNVTDQQDALSLYLEALLTEVGFAEDDIELDNTPLLDEVSENVAPVLARKTVKDKPLALPFAQSFPLVINPPVISPPVFTQAVFNESVVNEPVLNEPVLGEAELLPDLMPESFTPADSAQSIEAGQSVEPGQIEESISKYSNRGSVHSVIANNTQDADNESAGAVEASIEIPVWAQSRFQCLMFSVAGMKIAAPLEKLNGIIEWPKRITLLPGRASWVMGLYRNRDTNVQIMDLAQILHMEDRCLITGGDSTKQAKYIMLIDEGRIGLASDSVANMLTLEPQAVKWRAISKRQLLVSGTVVEHMCALLDIDALIRHINNS